MWYLYKPASFWILSSISYIMLVSQIILFGYINEFVLCQGMKQWLMLKEL